MKTTSAALVNFYCCDKTSQQRQLIEDKVDVRDRVCAGAAKTWEPKGREDSAHLEEQT